jgi:tetratricopeptide (TPR) repeat protein
VELLTTLLHTPEHARHELDLLLPLAEAVHMTKGEMSLDYERLCVRAHALCQQLGDTPRLLEVLTGLRKHYEVRGQCQRARELAEQIFTLTVPLQDPARLVEAHYSLGLTLYYLGEIPAARAAELGLARWLPMTVHQRGWVLAAQGQHAEGIAQMREGLSTLQATGAELAQPRLLALLAEAYGHGGQAEAGQRVVAEALAVAQRTGERRDEAEISRVKGELLLQHAVANAPEAEACFQQALALARRQQAKSWELRAAMSLARLWQCQGKRAEARGLLTEIYGWFIEGFDTADLQDAKALRKDLSS